MIAIYTRQSIDKKDSISIETQVEMCQKEIKTQGLEFKIYKDKGFSGKTLTVQLFKTLWQMLNKEILTLLLCTGWTV